MPITNDVNSTISEEDLKEISAVLDKLYGMLEPKTISLTPKLRQKLPKIGDKNLAFVEKTIDLAVKNPDFVPSFVNLEESKKDFNRAKTIRVIKRKIGIINQKLEDTGIKSGNEAFSASLVIYNHITDMAKTIRSVEAQKARDELSVRFRRNSSKSKGQKAASD